ncbi:hypothetical protein MCERH3_01333 [Candidatus Nanopelagicaceae bacterium]
MMHILKLLSKRPKVILGSPPASRLLIYDQIASSAFLDAIRPYAPQFMAIRGEEYYLTIALKSFLKYICRKRKGRLMDNYIAEYIRCVDPVLLGTNLDIDARFWSLEIDNLNCQKFFVQHGILDGSIVNESYLDSNNMRVDFMFTFSNESSVVYRDMFKIEGAVQPIGSIKNNAIRIQEALSNRPKILYLISEWEPNTNHEELSIVRSIIEVIHLFCYKNSLELRVLPRFRGCDSSWEGERIFFDSIGISKIEVQEKISDLDNYKLCSEAVGVVFFYSTLGYELGVRGETPICCINFRAQFENNPNRHFGWPSPHFSRIKGLTNEPTKSEIMKVLEELLLGGIDQKIFKSLLNYDPDNLIFKSFLKNKLN